MRKIVHITTVHQSFDIRIFYKECVSLARVGYDVTLIAPHNKQEILDGVKIFPIKKHNNRVKRAFLSSWSAFLNALKLKADIYHFHDPELILVGVLLSLLGKKVIYDVHEDLPKQILSKYWIYPILRKPISYLAYIIEKVAEVFFKGIVAATPGIAEKFHRKKTVIIYNFPLLKDFTEVKIQKEQTSLIYTGAISITRGILEMIEAIHLSANEINTKLILVGKFTPNSLYNKVQGMLGWKYVTYEGSCSYKDVVKKYTEASIGLVVLHPTKAYLESYPIKLFEYMAAGLPVIASDFPLWREIIESSKCGLLVNPLDPDEIAKAIKHLLDCPDLATELGRNGRRAAVEKYSWENEEKKLLALYKKILWT